MHATAVLTCLDIVIHMSRLYIPAYHRIIIRRARLFKRTNSPAIHIRCKKPFTKKPVRLLGRFAMHMLVT